MADLTEADVADLAAWHRDRKPSILQRYQDRWAEMNLLKHITHMLDMEEKVIKMVAKKHNIRGQEEEVKKLQEEAGEALDGFEKVMKDDMDAMAVYSYILSRIIALLNRWMHEHLTPERLARIEIQALEKDKRTAQKDFHIVQLMGQKLEKFAT